jgi:hypothetical protein
VVATVVCGCGGSVGVGCVDMQVRCDVIFALGHCVLHFQAPFWMLHMQSSTCHLKALSKLELHRRIASIQNLASGWTLEKNQAAILF